MTQQEALWLIDSYKNKLVDPVEILKWTWLRVTILHIDEAEWEIAAEEAAIELSK